MLVRVYAAGLDRGVWHVMRELIEAGKVTAVIARTFRLSEVPQAFGIWLRNTEAAARSGLPCEALCPHSHGLYRALILVPGKRVTWSPKCRFH